MTLLPLLPLLILGCAPEQLNDTESTTASESAWDEAEANGEIVTNRILVQRRDGIRENIRFKNRQLTLLRDMTSFDIQEIEVPEGVDYREVILELNESGEYTIVEPVVMRSIPQTEMVPFSGEMVRAPNDPFYQFQKNMDIVQATDATEDGTGIVVAVIDTGVGTGGNDTPVNMVAGYDFVNDDNDATDDQGHGTHVAGTIAQATNNSVGVIGVAPNVSIMPLKSLGADGTGFSSDSIAAMEFAMDNGADVVNMSLGSTTASASEEAAVDALTAAGIAVVAANGNDGNQTNGINYPAAYDNSIAVSATDHQGVITGYSNAGPETDIAAPGGDVSVDTDSDGQVDGILQETIVGGSYNYYFFEGTSMATPHVAGAVALVMGAGATAAEAESFLKSTASDLGATGTDNLYGAGEIRIQDAIDAYESAQSSTPGVDSLQAGDIFITEVMHNPDMVVDYRGEWIELYNNSGAELNLNGLQIDNGSDAGITVGQDVLVAAGDYVVLGVFASSIGNGGFTPDYVYSYNDLRLNKDTTLTVSNASTVLDTLTYSSSTHSTNTAGVSLSLDSLTPADNDVAGNWCVSTTSYGDGDLGTPGSANDSCPTSVSLSGLNAGDLVISEVMVDPASVADFRGEWFEIYNNTADTVDLNGLNVACGGNNGFSVSGTKRIPAGSTALLAVRNNAGINGGMGNVDVLYSYGDCSFQYSDSISISANGTTFDSVTWDSNFPFSSGSSMSLGVLDTTSNDSSTNWCAATSTYGDGDSGTPGEDNETCPDPGLDSASLGAGDLIISEIMTNPVTVSDYRGEWFEVYNNSGFTINLNGLSVSSSNNTGFTISHNVTVEPESYTLFAVNPNGGLNGELPQVDVAYSYGDISFRQTDDLTLSASGTTIDTVSIDGTYPDGLGASLSLDTLSASANDSMVNWCESTSGYGSGEAGTPGAVNDTCP